METIRNYESNDSVQNNPEKQQEAIRQETDRLFSVLESPNITADDLNSLVDKFASNNPRFQTELTYFQDYNSSRLEDMLRSNMTIEQCDIDDPLDYFGVRLEFEGLSNELESIGLDLGTLLGDYKDSLENNLDGLDQESIEKVKLSIINKLKQISEIITDLRSDEIDKYGNLDRFSENRWIINEKIGEHLSFINSELLPSLEAYVKLKGGAQLDTKFSTPEYNARHRNINSSYVKPEYHIGEIEELLQAHVDEEGNFDEGFFSTQNLFDMNNPKHAEMLSSLGINSHEVNLLNEKDKKIEQEAILYFMAMIGVQIGVETLGGVVGTVIGGGVDVYDTFSSEEELLNIAKALGLANKEFRMDKTWVDNVLAGLGLIPGGTQIIKGSRLADFMKKVDPTDFNKATEKIKEALGIPIEKAPNKTNKVEKLANNELLSIIDIEFREYEYFKDVLKKFILDDKHPMNIVGYLRNPETKDVTISQLKKILKLGENNISQEEMVRVINAIYEGESILLKSNDLKRIEDLKNTLLESDPRLFEIGGELSYNQRKLLKAHAERLSSQILPSLKNKLNDIISHIPSKDGFPAINARAKSADGIMDKIGRMRAGNDGKSPRVNYSLSDMPDAVGGRITVTDIHQLEQIMGKIEDVFGKNNIYEIDNFYSSAKKENPYRVITYTVLVDGVPCEIQLTTLKSSLVADIWHNTGYKEIHELPKEVIEKLANLQRQTTLYEHNLLK